MIPPMTRNLDGVVSRALPSVRAASVAGGQDGCGDPGRCFGGNPGRCTAGGDPAWRR